MSSILLLFIVVPILTLLLLVLSLLFAVNNPDSEKVSAYECGFSPVYGQTRIPFNVAYYLVAILFLLFDLEIFLIFPLAVIIFEVTIYGYVIGIGFFLVLTLGFIYEWSKGALYFTKSSNTSISDIRP